MATTQQDVIKKFMASLDKTTKSGTKAVDEAIQAATGGKIKSTSTKSATQALIEKMLADREKAENAADFLKNYCGIILNNTDTGAITGSDAGGKTTKTATSVVPNKKFDTSFDKLSFTLSKYGVTFQLAYQDEEYYRYPLDNFNKLTPEEKYVWRGLYSFWAEESLKLIEESYGYSFKDSDVKAKKIRVFFVDDSSQATAKTYNQIYEDSNEKRFYIHINMNYFKNIPKTDLDGNLPSDKYPYWEDYYLDRLIAHELTHAIMNVKVNNFSKLPMMIAEGLAELTTGMDDSQDTNLIKAASSKDMLQKLLVLKEDYNKVDGINNEDYVAGYMFLRYLAKQYSDSTNATSGLNITNSKNQTVISGSAYGDTITSNGNNVTIKSGAGNDSITAYGNKLSINGGTGNNYIYLYSNASTASALTDSGKDSIYSAAQIATINSGNGDDYIMLYTNATKNTVNAGDGKDKIYSGAQTARINAGAGNDYIHLYSQATKHTVNSGKGNDTIQNYAQGGITFLYTNGDGNDTITKVSAGDTIKISGSEYEKVTLSSSSDVTLKVGTGSILLQNAKNVSFKIDGKEKTKSLNITNSKKNTVISGTNENDTIKNIAGGVKIKGGAGSDSIYSSTEKNYTVKSAYGYVTIDGGAGNDIIYNNDPNVSISGGVGNDSIYSKSSTVTIRGGAGADSITNYSRYAQIYGDDDGDRIENYAGGVKIYAGTGNDFIKNTNDKDVTINNSYGYVTIDAGDGNDTIDNNDPHVSISAGAGNDRISVGSYANVTVAGGKGNDTIYGNRNNYGVLYQYASGDGNDTITKVSASDTIKISGAEYEKVTLSSSSNVTLKVGTGSILLQNAKNVSFKIDGKEKSKSLNVTNSKNQTVISGSAYGDTITSSGNNVTIKSGAGNDSIKAYGNKISINGGTGNNYIYFYANASTTAALTDSGKDSIYSAAQIATINSGNGDDYIMLYTNATKNTVNAGDGKDKIYSGAQTARINAGAGNDYIHLYSQATKHTVNAGKGNDTIQNYAQGGVTYLYAKGDGNDVINGWTAKDTLSISGGSYKLSTVGNNVKVSITGGSAVTLVGAKGKTVNIKSSSKSSQLAQSADMVDSFWFDENNFISDETQLDSITEISTTNYSVGKIETSTSYDVFKPDENFIAASTK